MNTPRFEEAKDSARQITKLEYTPLIEQVQRTLTFSDNLFEDNEKTPERKLRDQDINIIPTNKNDNLQTNFSNITSQINLNEQLMRQFQNSPNRTNLLNSKYQALTSQGKENKRMSQRFNQVHRAINLSELHPNSSDKIKQVPECYTQLYDSQHRQLQKFRMYRDSDLNIDFIYQTTLKETKMDDDCQTDDQQLEAAISHCHSDLLSAIQQQREVELQQRGISKSIYPIDPDVKITNKKVYGGKNTPFSQNPQQQESGSGGSQSYQSFSEMSSFIRSNIESHDTNLMSPLSLLDCEKYE